ncbi:hypothetical protein B0H13DRAFT_1874148 [Mycena leptocephala]|nr:hypothetical protein B0H13DRAFT_1874148 [Mycena leptocephala]
MHYTASHPRHLYQLILVAPTLSVRYRAAELEIRARGAARWGNYPSTTAHYARDLTEIPAAHQCYLFGRPVHGHWVADPSSSIPINILSAHVLLLFDSFSLEPSFMLDWERMKGPNNDKKMLAVRIGAHTFEIIHLLTDQNLILQVLVDTIVNTGSREDSNRIGSPGTIRWQADDVSPLRRTRESAYCNVKSTAECLADKLINVQKAHPPRMSLRKRSAWPSQSVNPSLGGVASGGFVFYHAIPWLHYVLYD